MLPAATGCSPGSPQITQQRHSHTGFVSVGVGDDDSSLVGFHLQDWAKQGIQLCIYQDNVLAVSKCVEDHASRRLDRTRHFDDYVDVFAGIQD